MNAVLALAALFEPSPALNRADLANAAFTQCLFGEVRLVRTEGLALAEAQERVRSACRTEEATVIATGSAVLRARGATGAAERMKQLTASLRAQVVRLLATENELARAADRACHADDVQCGK